MSIVAIQINNPLHVDKFDMDISGLVVAFEKDFHVIQDKANHNMWQVSTVLYWFLKRSIFEEDCCPNLNCGRAFKTETYSAWILSSEWVNSPEELFLDRLRANYESTEIIE